MAEPRFKMYPAGWFMLFLFAGAIILKIAQERFPDPSVNTSSKRAQAPVTPDDDPYEKSDKLLRAEFAGMDEVKLREAIFKTSIKLLEPSRDPELYVREALIAESLTRFDSKNRTNNWDRAATHFREAIDCYKEQLTGKPSSYIVARRVAVLHLYRGIALRQQGKHYEGKEVLSEALKHPDVRGRASEAMKQQN